MEHSCVATKVEGLVQDWGRGLCPADRGLKPPLANTVNVNNHNSAAGNAMASLDTNACQYFSFNQLQSQLIQSPVEWMSSLSDVNVVECLSH